MRRFPGLLPRHVFDLYDWLFLALPFLVGAAAGVFLSFICRTQLKDTLAVYFPAFVAGAAQGPTVPLSAVCFSAVRLPALLLLSGVSVVGLFCVPVLLLGEGFLTAFCAAAFGLYFGTTGVLFSLFLIGVPGLLFLPADFLTGHVALRTYDSLFHSSGGVSRQQELFVTLLAAAALLLAGICVEYLVLPRFWNEMISIL